MELRKNDIKINILEIDKYILFQGCVVLTTQRIIDRSEDWQEKAKSIIEDIKEEMCKNLKQYQTS